MVLFSPEVLLHQRRSLTCQINESATFLASLSQIASGTNFHSSRRSRITFPLRPFVLSSLLPISLYFPLSISASFPLRRRRKREKSLDIFGAFWGKYVHPSVSYLGARPSACGHVHLYFIIVSEVTFLLA